MKVVIKAPEGALKTTEVNDLKEINKLVGNVDQNGDGLDTTGSDSRKPIFNGIDIYMNEAALFNPELPENFWDINGFNLYCGTVIFAGYDKNCPEAYGVCSLTDEQIDYLLKNIHKVFDI